MPSRRSRDEFRYTVPAVEKAFTILELFVSENHDLSMSEVSRRLKLPISTTSSLLQTLLRCGYLARNSRRLYSLTLKLLTEGNKTLNNLEIRHVAHEELRKLTASTGFTSFLAILEGDHLVYVDKVDGSGEFKLSAQIGRRSYLHATSTGKALLAFMPEEQVDTIARSAGLPAATPNTITSLLTLKKELAKVRARCYSTDEEESSIGIKGIAAPIFSHEGKVIAAVCAAAAIFQVGEDLDEVIASVKSSAAAISEKMGYRLESQRQMAAASLK